MIPPTDKETLRFKQQQAGHTCKHKTFSTCDAINNDAQHLESLNTNHRRNPLLLHARDIKWRQNRSASFLRTKRQREREREREKRERKKDRETETQRHRETERQRDRETERQRDTETERQRNRETER